MTPEQLPRRVAEVVHALMEASGSHVSDGHRGPLITAEVLMFDSCALTPGHTAAALTAARRLRLVDSAPSPEGTLWFPTSSAWEMRRALEDFLLGEDSNDG